MGIMRLNTSVTSHTVFCPKTEDWNTSTGLSNTKEMTRKSSGTAT